MGKRSGQRLHGDARLRVVPGGAPGSGQRKRGTTAPGDAMQPLVQDLRRRLRDEDPWQLLALLSTLVEGADGRPGPDGTPLDVEAIVEPFIGIDLAETTAALHGLAVLVGNDAVMRDIDAELTHRRQPMPLWLRDIRELRVTSTQVLSADGDRGEDIVLGVEWSGTTGGSFVVYVDHGLGTVVKDAFPVPGPFAEVLDELEEASRLEAGAGAGLVREEIEPAEARALLEEALDNGDVIGADYASDTWPATRSILDWLLSTMPVGQSDRWAHRDLDLDDEYWDEDDEDDDIFEEFVDEVMEARAEILADFAASAAATTAGINLTGSGTDETALALIVGSAGFAPEEEFLLWTPERVEELLSGTLLRGVLLDERTAQRIPPLLKTFAVWCLGQVDAPEDDIVAVRDAVDEGGPVFVATATSREAGQLREAIRAYADLLGDEVGLVPIVESHEERD